MIYKAIRFKQMPYYINTKILYYLNQTGYIVGYKKIYKNITVPIIEFKDFTRIWMLPNEIID